MKPILLLLPFTTMGLNTATAFTLAGRSATSTSATTALRRNERGSALLRSRNTPSVSLLLSGGGGDDDDGSNGNGFLSQLDGKNQGRITLLFVAFLYGTLNVTLKAVYGTPGAPTPAVLSVVRQVLSTLCFIPLLLSDKQKERLEDDDGGEGASEGTDGAAGPMWKAALELAFWNFGAQGLLNAGLVLSPAARAAFLCQTSVVITPLLSAALGERVRSVVWAGCSLALCGLYLLSTGGGGDAAAAAAFNQGDFLILGGAAFWSVYIYRTSKLAGAFQELELQATKTALIAVMYGIWAFSTATTAFLSPAGGWEAVQSLWSGYASLPVWILLAYSAVGPGAIADVLQQRGQKEVSASEANVLVCFESVFAAVCAFAFLGEVSSLREIAGGMLIVAAAVLASL